MSFIDALGRSCAPAPRLLDHPGEAALQKARKRLQAADKACRAATLAGPHKAPLHFRATLLRREVAAAQLRLAYADMLNIPPPPN